ncbi:hypothetical protein ABBQ32_013176 [Trebouxia sp. C0010 RCD-2024]
MTSNVKRIQVNGLNFAVTDQGDAGATAVVLLHGFPNNKNMWGKQIPPLLEAGYRVVAPDLRGALGGESYSPQEPEAYHIEKDIVKDVAGILDALNIKKAHIVGHDWGSPVAWAFAALYPERTLKLVAITVGHPSGMMKGEHRGAQKQKSWYVLMLNIPGDGEKAMTSGTMFDGLQSEEAQAMDGPMFQELGMIEAMQKPGAVTAAINWYRANANVSLFLTGAMFECPLVTCDTLQIFFSGDSTFCTEGQAKSSGQYVKSPGTFQ